MFFESSWFKMFGRAGGDTPKFRSSHANPNEPNVLTFNFQTFSRWNQYLDQQIPLSPMIMMLCLTSWLQYGQTELDAALT